MAENIVTLNLRKDVKKYPDWLRSAGIAVLIKRYLGKKFRGKKIVLSEKVNKMIWKSGAKAPETRFKLKIVEDDKSARADLME